MNRRDFLWHSGGGLGGIALAALLQNDGEALGESSLPGAVGARAAVWADYNGDGRPDLLLATASGPKLYTEVRFAPDDYLVFGRETAGLPKQLLEQNRERWLRIPMFNELSRSLNLSNCAALVLFEALRQQGFDGEWSGT